MNRSRFTYTNCCRICTEDSSETHNLFEIRHRGTTLSEMISFCTHLALQENDNSRPSNICRSCIGNLRTAYDFCKLAKASEEKFHELDLSQSAAIFAEPIESILVKEEEHGNIEDVNVEFKNFVSPPTIGDCLKVEIKEEDNAMNVDEPPKESKTKIKTKNSYQKSKRAIVTPIKPWGNSEVLQRLDTKWQCYKCKVDMPYLEFLRIHMKGHNDGTPHECTVCGLHFSKTLFDRHLCMGESVQCEYCPKSFVVTNKLIEHLEIHKNHVVINRCAPCKKRLPMKKLYEFHMHHHHAKKPSICTICNQRFNSRSGMTLHTNTKHRLEECKEIF